MYSYLKNIDKIIYNTINLSKNEISKLQKYVKFKNIFNVFVLLGL